MSGSAIPYHIRPHKAVDRRLFLDLLSRYERWSPLKDHVYISMGAYPLEDHKQVYRVLGLTKLIAFDMDDHVVSRQKFNRPTENCICLKYKSGDFIDQLDTIIDKQGFGSSRIVFWLDYTVPSAISEQIREFERLLGKLAPGDIVRVTVNSEPENLGSSRMRNNKTKKPLGSSELHKFRFKNLNTRMGEYLPSDAKPAQMTEQELPKVIAAAFGKAAAKAIPPQSSNQFMLLSAVRYADGQQMLSVTGTVVEKSKIAEIETKLDLGSWPLSSRSWDKVHQLVVPALTVRERLFLERSILSMSSQAIIQELGFGQAGDIEISKFLDSYRNYFRFYPTLLPTEV